jgi:hypothetical protein
MDHRCVLLGHGFDDRFNPSLLANERDLIVINTIFEIRSRSLLEKFIYRTVPDLQKNWCTISNVLAYNNMLRSERSPRYTQSHIQRGCFLLRLLSSSGSDTERHVH